jgi:hypothetical protein
MKKILSLIAISLTIAKSDAAVLLVNNATANPGQYLQIDAAMAAASPGDTIYVNGSSVIYSSCIVTKSITLIGAGTFAQKQNQFPSKIQYVDINSNLSNIVIEGLEITGSIRFVSESNIQNVFIRYNYFSTGDISFNNLDNSSNFVVSSNIFNSNSFAVDFNGGINQSNFTIENNIIRGYIRSMNVNNATINNNVFYNYATPFITNLNSALIINNIFYNSNPLTNTTNCTYLNNISYGTSTTYGSMGGNNIDNTNPQFITAVSPTGGYLPTYNFGVQTSSPAHNYGNDGKDLGIYGGSANVTVTGEVYNVPVIRQMILQNTNVPQNGNVNVKVRSTKSRTN